MLNFQKSNKTPEIFIRKKVSISTPDIEFFDVREEPFSIYGLYDAKNQPIFKRMPDFVAENTSKGVYDLYTNTSGGRVRFVTDSDCIYIRVKLPTIALRPNMSMIVSMGFDLYQQKKENSVHVATFIPPMNIDHVYECKAEFKTEELRYFTLNFPLYNDVEKVEIGVKKGSRIEKHPEYKNQKPILYYGSSITQGAIVSRPGICYQNWISRRLDCDYINLGFSGSCLGEETIVSYMKTLDIRAFVCDYDHNAPDSAHLLKTHYNVYKSMRDSHKDIPIILISKPDIVLDSKDDVQRRAVVMETYQRALGEGDENVYFIDGYSFFAGRDREEFTVDKVHPNDLGHYRMADIIGKTLEFALFK